MDLPRSLKHRLSRIRRRTLAPARPGEDSGRHQHDAPPGVAPSPRRESGRIDRIYRLPPPAVPRDRSRPAVSMPVAATLPSPAPWTDLPVLTAPPPFVPVETACGIAHVRSFTVTVPRALRLALARTEAGARRRGMEGSSIALDTEAMGLGSVTLFLVGFAWFEGADVRVEQVYAQDHSREAALLVRVAERWRGAGRLVTYNGRSYDLPLIRDRSIRHRLPPLPTVPDVDLLTHARRRWRAHLPDCRLATVEGRILGRPRWGDVHGAEIPGLYRRTVRTEDPRLMAPVLHHNALDLLATLELLPRLDPDVG